VKEIKSTTYANNNHIQAMRIIFVLFVFVAIPILFCLSKKKSVVRRITGALLCLVFVYLVFVAFFLFHHPKVPDMTKEKAQQLFETVGGVDEVNRETKVLFDQLGTNEWTFLYPQDLTNSPAISSLYSILKNYSGREYSGTDVAIFPENGRHLEIKFGNHWSLKWIYIFDTNAATTFNSSSNYFQMASNIFVSK
jgi:hypothetical protein